MTKPIKPVEERRQVVIDDYKKVYKLVYGVHPTVTDDGVYVRVTGQQTGVDLRRLKTLTTQLRNVHRNTEYVSSSDKSSGRPGKMFRS